MTIVLGWIDDNAPHIIGDSKTSTGHIYGTAGAKVHVPRRGHMVLGCAGDTRYRQAAGRTIEVA